MIERERESEFCVSFIIIIIICLNIKFYLDILCTCIWYTQTHDGDDDDDYYYYYNDFLNFSKNKKLHYNNYHIENLK